MAGRWQLCGPADARVGTCLGLRRRPYPPWPNRVCIYLIYPAFYADVSESWKLPRSRRAVVDAGGMYMSLVCASVASGAFLITREPVSKLLAILCDITVFWNLNPFIRMDGYWLLSDLLGVQNLMSVNRDVTWWLLGSVFGRKHSAPSILSPVYRFRSLYIAYYSAFLIFLGYASVHLGGHYLPELVRAYPGLTANLTASFQRFREIGSVVKALFYWLLGTLPLVWILLLLLRWTIALFRAIRKWSFS